MIDVYISPVGGGGGSGGAVTSVFGRIGAVVAAANDYSVAQVNGAAPLASPALTGTPTAPTAAPLDNSTNLATTAYADAAVLVESNRALAAEALLAPLASPALTGSPTAPTQTLGDASANIATDAFVAAAIAAALKPNPSFCTIIEEFIGGSSTTGTIGQNGWFFDTIGSTPTFTGTQAVTPNLGIIQFNTAVAATAGQGGGMRLVSLASSSGTVVNNLQGNVGWELQWIFKLSQTTATRFRVGIATSDTVIVPAEGLTCRYDTNVTFGDTNFIFESTKSGVVTSIDSTIPVDTNWHRVKITSTVSGTAIFSLYNSAGVLQATKNLAISTISSLGMSPIAIIGTDATAQKSVQLDYMSFFFPALAR
jgi:hypothetical protein